MVLHDQRLAAEWLGLGTGCFQALWFEALILAVSAG